MSTGHARYAIYFVPEADDPLANFGSGVLGYDCRRETDVAYHSALLKRCPAWPTLVADARRYGFHATLKAPFRLAPNMSESDLLRGVSDLARELPAADLGRLSVQPLGRHAALRPTAHPVELTLLEDRLVRRLDGFRAPLSDAEIARRVPDRLSPQQRDALANWGYPFCLQDFRFHMTLAGPFTDNQREAIIAALDSLYQPYDAPLLLKTISLVRQDAPSLPFRVLHTLTLGGASTEGFINSTFILSHR